MDLTMDQLYECEGRIEAITENGGVLIIRAEDGEKFWVPQDVIDEKSECYKNGDEGVILIEYKFAEKKGMV